MKWFSENPHGPNPGIRGEMMYDWHQTGKSWFPSSMAQGGNFASTAFAPTIKEGFKAPWRRTAKYGSSQHIDNLRKMQAADPSNTNIHKAIEKASKGSSKASLLKATSSFGLGAAFIALPAFTTPGSGKEKARAVAGGAVSFAGVGIGSKIGAGVFGAIGTLILPGPGTIAGAAIGTVIGGLGGAIGFDEGFQALTRIPDRMVEGERARRNLSWKNDMTAFQTRRASTMRQLSLQAMNRGQMTARSMLGREGIMLHQ